MAAPDAILLDLDCTLTDRRQSILAFATEFERRFANDLLPLHGTVHLDPSRADRCPSHRPGLAALLLAADGNGRRPRREFLTLLQERLPWTNVPASGVLESFWRAAFPACTRPAPALHVTLQRLARRGARIGIVTNGTAAAQRTKIQQLGIERHLSAVIVSGEAGFRKPDPRIFHAALSAIGAGSDRTWFAGDDPVLDVAAAEAAGLSAVWICGESQRPYPERNLPTPRITRVAHLPHLLDGSSGFR